MRLHLQAEWIFGIRQLNPDHEIAVYCQRQLAPDSMAVRRRSQGDVEDELSRSRQIPFQ